MIVLCRDGRINGRLELQKQLEAHIAKELDATGDAQAELAGMRAEPARKIAAHVQVEGPVDTAMPGLILSRRTAPSECLCTTYEPELVVFALEEKRISVGGTTHLCDGTSFLLTSVDLLVEGQIIKASKSEPHLALVLKLDIQGQTCNTSPS